MLFLRPVRLDDLEDLLRISKEVGIGMSTMPKEPKVWKKKITESINSFNNPFNDCKSGSYFMVAEDYKSKKIVGTTAIYVGIGTILPFYSYRLTTLVKYSKELNKTTEIKVLNLVNDLTGATEIGSLYLDKNYRHSSYGQFMSRSRYLLMSDFPARFSNNIIAEIRGWLDANGVSPFWRSLTKKFFDLPFEYASNLSATKGNQFIQDLMPKYPVYVDLLSKQARNSIGRPHDISAKAVYMLNREGFFHDGYIDVFDAGPVFHCRREQIKSVRETKVYRVKITDNIVNNSQRYLISNRNIENYRIILHFANIFENIVEINKESAEILNVSDNDEVNLLAMMEKR